MNLESWQYTIIIVAVYAVFILWIGTGKWTKASNDRMDDYFKVGPGFGFLVLYLGMAGGFHTAFAIPGSMGFYHSHGVAFAANILWTVFTPLVMIYYVGSRITCLGRKFNYITPADMLTDYFGDGKFRAFIALYILSCCIPLMTANITGPAILLSAGTENHITKFAATLIMGFLVFIYVTTSGIRGVTWTTVAQAIWMFVAIWAAGYWCLTLIDGDLLALFNKVKEIDPSMLTLPGRKGLATQQWWLTWPVFGIAFYWAILPRSFMFYYSARDVKTVQKIGLTVGFYLMVLFLPAMVIGFTAFAYYPDIVNSDASFPTLLAEHAPAWFAGVLVAGGLAAGMSSLDADTNANSAMLTKDVYSKFIKKDSPDSHYIKVGRVIVFFLVVITVLAADKDWGLVTMMIGITASMIVQLLPAVLAVTVPMKRIWFTKTGITCGIMAGLIASFAVRFYGRDFLPAGVRYDPSFWGLVVNVPVALLVSRYTDAPDSAAVARIRAALDDEFRPSKKI
jgi:SSS family solute:Na+ symporter